MLFIFARSNDIFVLICFKTFMFNSSSRIFSFNCRNSDNFLFITIIIHHLTIINTFFNYIYYIFSHILPLQFFYILAFIFLVLNALKILYLLFSNSSIYSCRSILLLESLQSVILCLYVIFAHFYHIPSISFFI